MLGELFDWLVNLDAEFAFLLALPFVVAAAGFLSEVVRSRAARRHSPGHESAREIRMTGVF